MCDSLLFVVLYVGGVILCGVEYSSQRGRGKGQCRPKNESTRSSAAYRPCPLSVLVTIRYQVIDSGTVSLISPTVVASDLTFDLTLSAPSDPIVYHPGTKRAMCVVSVCLSVCLCVCV